MQLIDLDGATVTAQKDEPSFILNSPASGKTLWICKTDQDRDDWVKDIQGSIDETKELHKKGVRIVKEERQSSYLSSWWGGEGGAATTDEAKVEKKG